MKNNRHAYLILVHNCPRLLQVLIDMIDDERNDIYLHVDGKANIGQFANIRATKSKLIFTAQRIKVYWGNDSMINAEYVLFETAHRCGPYSYYHLLSGVDLPLKNQEYIHHFFDEEYRGHEFVGFTKNMVLTHRLRYYYLFGRYMRPEIGNRKARFFSFIRKYALSLQKEMGVWRNKNVTIMYGPTWVSITDDLCSFLLSQKKRIQKFYRMTSNPDESFIQTIVYNSPFYDNIHDKEDEYLSCMRLIDWEKEPNRSSPHTWRCQDWDELILSNRLFARKFSEEDMDFIYRIKDFVLKSNR